MAKTMRVSYPDTLDYDLFEMVELMVVAVKTNPFSEPEEEKKKTVYIDECPYL